jgi:hypothetical protein
MNAMRRPSGLLFPVVIAAVVAATLAVSSLAGVAKMHWQPALPSPPAIDAVSFIRDLVPDGGVVLCRDDARKDTCVVVPILPAF